MFFLITIKPFFPLTNPTGNFHIKPRIIMKKMFFSLVLVAGISTYTFAQTATPVIKEQQENQRERIQGGIKNGSLTRREAARLRNRKQETHQDIKEAKVDGVVTHEEKIDIKQEQKQTSRAIYRQKHDGQRRRLRN